LRSASVFTKQRWTRTPGARVVTSMRNILNYVCAGAEGFWDKKKNRWVFNVAQMPIDYYLINASTFIGSKDMEHAVEQAGVAMAHNKGVFCDSGGFQLATGVIDSIDPVGVAEVQNRCCTHGFILDVPTMKRARGAGAGGLELDASEDYFVHCLLKTVDNIRRAKSVEKKFQNYAIIQGVTYDQLRRWWEGISQYDTFQGIGTKGVILSQVLNGLFFAETTDVKCHHILGLGALPRIILAKYFYLLSKKDMTLITYDNTNHIQYAKNMQTVLPFMNCSYSKSADVDLFKAVTGIEVMPGRDETFYGSVRNAYYYGLQGRLINMLDTTNAVKDFVKSNFRKMEPYLEVIDDYFDKGIQYVIKKYKDLSEGAETKSKKTDLMDFI